MDPVAFKGMLAGDILGTSKPGQNRRSESVSVWLTKGGNSVQGTDHLDTAESDEVLDLDIVTLFGVE